MTIFDVVDGIAEDAAGFGFLEDGMVYARGGSGGDGQAGVIQIAAQKFSREPDQPSLDGPLHDLWRGFGSNYADGGFGGE